MSAHLSYSCALFPTISCPSVGLWHPALHCLSVLFCICMPVCSTFIRTSSIYVCMSVFLRPCVRSVYHVHSYVSVCLSATLMYTIYPFRTFLRLSVDLRVFVYVYVHVHILHVQLYVRLFVTFVRHHPNTCLCVQLSIRLNFVCVCKSVC